MIWKDNEASMPEVPMGCPLEDRGTHYPLNLLTIPSEKHKKAQGI